MKAVVMAGGFGTRLRPLTAHLPKPLVPVGNIPIMEHMVRLLKKHGFTDLCVLLATAVDEFRSLTAEKHLAIHFDPPDGTNTPSTPEYTATSAGKVVAVETLTNRSARRSFRCVAVMMPAMPA